MPLLHLTREPDAPQDDARFLPFSAAQRCLFAAAGASPAAIEIDLSRRICAAALQRAAEAAFSRYPYLNAVLSEGEDGVFLRAATPAVRPARAAGPRAADPHAADPRAADPRAAVEVSYEKKRIRIRFLRALHDARAVKPFAELLLARYFDPLPARPSFGIERIPSEERKDPFETLRPAGALLPFPKEPLRLPSEGTLCRFDVQVDGAEFRYAVRQNGATPVLFAALLWSRAVAERAVLYKKAVRIGLMTDVRTQLDCRGSALPCTLSLPLCYDAAVHRKPLPDAAAHLRSDLAILYDARCVRSLAAERARSPQEGNAPCSDTFSLNYFGTLLTRDGAKIESARLCIPDEAPLSVGMAAAGQTITFTCCQRSASSHLLHAFLRQLSALGIAYRYESVHPL